MELLVEMFNKELGYGLTNNAEHIMHNLGLNGLDRRDDILYDLSEDTSTTYFRAIHYFFVLFEGKKSPEGWLMIVVRHDVIPAMIDQICDKHNLSEGIRNTLQNGIKMLAVEIENDQSILDELVEVSVPE